MDIDTPLLSRKTYATFTRRTGKSRLSGRVYPQHRTKDDHRPHATGFYVEWPSGSESFTEIHAPTLAGISGHQSPPRHTFTCHEVASLIETLSLMPIPAVLHACQPKAS